MPLTIPSTAWSRGASSNTMLAALPPSSRVSFLPDPARVRWIALPTSVEPVKATLSTPVVADQGRPGGPGAGEDVDHALGQLGLPEDLAQAQGGQRRGLGRLEDHGVAGGQGRGQLPGGHQQREVPGDDLGGHPEGGRAAAGEGVLELVGPAGVVEEVGRGQGHVDVAGLLDRLAAVHRLQHRELPGPLLQHPGDPVQVLGPLGPGHPRPHLGVGGPGRLDGRVHVLLAGLGHLGQDLLGGRVDGLEGLLGGRLDPPPPDQQPVVGPQLDVVGRRCGSGGARGRRWRRPPSAGWSWPGGPGWPRSWWGGWSSWGSCGPGAGRRRSGWGTCGGCGWPTPASGRGCRWRGSGRPSPTGGCRWPSSTWCRSPGRR